MHRLALLLQDTPKDAVPSGTPNMLLWMAGLFAIFYFMMIRPQMKEQKKRREMLQALKKNDRVVTSSGIFGTITAIDDHEVTLRVDEANNVKLRMTRAAVAGLAASAAGADDAKA